MKDNFNIYKWRRDHLTENENPKQTVSPEELFKAFKEKFDTGSHRPDQNRIKTVSKLMDDKKVDAAIKLFNEKGYNVKIEYIDHDSKERPEEIYFDYTKK